MIHPRRNLLFGRQAGILAAALILLPTLLGWREPGRSRPKAKQIAAIHGVVFLPDGMLAPGARVSIRTMPKGKHWTAYTDQAGDFLQPVPVKPAKYRLRATVHGFAPGEAEVSVPGPVIVDIFVHLHKKPGTKSRR